MSTPGKVVKEALKGAQINRPDAEARQLAPNMPTVKPLDMEEQAVDLLDAELSRYDPEDTHQINFDRITTTDEIKATIGEMAEKNQGAIDEARRGTITNTELAGLAEDLNLDVDIVGSVMSRESGGVLNAEQILGARQVLNKSAQRLRRLAQKVQAADASDMDKLAFRRQFEWHSEYQQQFMGARAEAGRALGAFNIPVGTDDMQLGRTAELANAMQGGNVSEMASLVLSSDSLAGINRATREYRGSRAMGVVQEVFINSILSGIKTHVINTAGMPLFEMMNITETALAAQIGKFLPGEAHVQVGEASAMLTANLTGWRDALRAAGKAMRTGQTVDNVAKLETGRPPAISSQTFPEVSKLDQVLKNEFGVDTPVMAMALDGLGAFIRFPTERLMAAEDEAAKTLLFRSGLAQMAVRDASEKVRLGQITQEEMPDYIRRFLDNPPKNAMQFAEDKALYGTFQNPLGPLGQQVQRFINQVPGLKLIAPFVRTPVNLFKTGLGERSPTALLSRKFREQIKNGGPERDLALARLTMGSLTAASVSAAVAGGHVTGGGPSNFQARKALEATGWQPYSIKVTNPATGEVTYQSYMRAEPLAFVIGAVADATEILAHVDFEDELTPQEEAAMDVVNAVVAGVAENTLSKTFVSGIDDFLNAVEDPERYLEGYLKRQAGAFVPYSSLRRDIAKIQDPYIREAWTLADKLRQNSGIPGYSEELPLSLDLYGNPRQYASGAIVGPLSPFPDSPETGNALAHDVVALMEESGRVPITMPARTLEGLRLSAQEYQDFVDLSRNQVEIAGKDFDTYMSDLMTSTAYERMGPDGKVDLIKDAQRTFDAEARRQLVDLYDTGEDDSLAARLRRRQDVKAERKLGEFMY